MNTVSLALVGWLAAAVVAQGATAAQDGPVPTPSRCAALLQQADPTVQILTSTSVAEGPLPGAGNPGAAAASLPAHCVAAGVIDRRIGVGGKEYSIRFEARLPDRWNGRFLFQGGGE